MERILADENVDRPIVLWLREQGHDVVEVAAVSPGATDEALIRLSRQDDRVLVTFDRDVGRLLMSSRDVHPGVVYLRLKGIGPAAWEAFRRNWPAVESTARGHFVTMRDHQARRRPIPMGGDA